MGEVDDWQSGKSVLECNKHMMSNQISYDVILLVGDEKVKIPAHIYVLASRSCVFYAMLCGPVSEKTGKAIVIKDIEPDIFRMLLQYMYCDEVKIDLDNALPLLYAAKKYSVKTLEGQCLKRLKACLSPDNVCTVLEHAHIYEENGLKQFCMDLIFRQSTLALASSAFSELCPTCLESILKSDRLAISEEDVFDSVLSWARKQCEKKKQQPDGSSLRTVLGKLVYFIRFSQMDPKYFSEFVADLQLLKPDEIILIFRHFCGGQSQINGFNNRRRVRRLTFERFAGLGSGWNYIRDKGDTIAFTSSADIFLHGVLIYGSHQNKAVYSTILHIYDDEMKPLVEVEDDMNTDGEQKCYECYLAEPLRVEKGKVYTILLKMQGPGSFCGARGRSAVTCENVTVTFLQTDKGNNGTNVLQGQIPGLLCETLPE